MSPRWQPLRAAVLALPVLVLGLGAACGTTAPSAPTAPDDARRVDVMVSGMGYAPDEVIAEPGETLVLVFDRPDAANCGEELVFPASGRKVELPVGAKTEVVVTAPSDGRLAFTCGMGMYQGAIVLRN